MKFKIWITEFFEDTMVIGQGSPDPEDNGLSRPQTYKPHKKFSDLAADVFLTKDPEKKKKYKAKHLQNQDDSYGVIKSPDSST